jgi:hypothetical protein
MGSEYEAGLVEPGGRLRIADLRHSTHDYAQELEKLGMNDISVRGLGWRFWYGGPWVAASLVTATKPECHQPARVRV